MDTARQAGRILEAWNLPNSGYFEAELESAFALCETETPVSELEYEQQAVLQSVVQCFRQASQSNYQGTSALPKFEAGFFLLRHLHSRAA